MAGGGLRPRQRAFVAAVGSLYDVKKAAEAVGISERTAYRWMTEPAVRAAVDEIYARVMDQVVGTVCPRLAGAVGVLEDVFGDEEEKSSVRVSAAGIVVNASARVAAAYARGRAERSAEDRSELEAMWERMRAEGAAAGPVMVDGEKEPAGPEE